MVKNIDSKTAAGKKKLLEAHKAAEKTRKQILNDLKKEMVDNVAAVSINDQ